MTKKNFKKQVNHKAKYSKKKNLHTHFFRIPGILSKEPQRKTVFIMICLVSFIFFSSQSLSYDFLDTEPFPWATEEPEGKIILVNDDFTDDAQNHKWNSIQEGINDAEAGDLIYVYNGSYYENLVINQSIDIIGEDTEKVIVNGGGKLVAIDITAPWVKMGGFTVLNAHIGIQGHNFTQISHLNIHQCSKGIDFKNSSFTLITNLTLFSCHYGIFLNNFSNGSVVNCTVYNNDWGIFTLSSHDIIISNTLSYNIENKSILIENSSRILVENCNISQSFCGIAIRSSLETLINNCFLHHNLFGIRLYKSTRNTITYSTILQNDVYGIYILGSSYNNSIHHNNFFDNDNTIFPQQVFDNSNNQWDTVLYWDPEIWDRITGPWGHDSYWHKIWNWPLYSFALQGNYWSDYNGGDTNRDGIGDIPHRIPGGDNLDQYPFVTPIGCPVSYFSYLPQQNLSTNTMINFIDQSVPHQSMVTNWHWDFGDETYSFVQNPSHSYMNNGLFNATLSITNEDGLTDSFSVLICISNSPPVANFSYESDGYYITTNASSSLDKDGSIIHYSWDWGDGNGTEGITSYHVYSSEGIYPVTLTITDDDGSTKEITKTVTFSPPSVHFSFTPPMPTDRDLITFSDASYDSDGTISSWEWELGDGTVVNTHNLTYQYLDDGIFNVTLTVKDDKNLTATLTKTITVSNIPPSPNFTYFPQLPTDDTFINYTDTSHDLDGHIINWTWDFGDGHKAYTIHTSHQYSDDGIYQVTLTIIDNDNSSISSSSLITIGNQPPLPNFTYSSPTLSTLDPVNFTDTTLENGVIINWTWQFGNGEIAYGNTASCHYTQTGTYNVTLSVMDDDNAQSQITKEIVIVNLIPLAEFSHIPTHPMTSQMITFNASISTDPDGDIYMYEWDWDNDGTFDESHSDYMAMHQWDDNELSVTLRVTDNEGAQGYITKTLQILNRPPLVEFSFSPENPEPTKTVSFNNHCSDIDGFIKKYEWNFGDGATSTLPNPQHIYVQKGLYTVKLTVWDDDNDNAISTKIITINTPPQADFIYTPSKPMTQDNITFTDASLDNDGDIISFVWDFGDGNTSSGKNVNHTYSSAGYYNVTLTIKDDNGAASSISRSLVIKSIQPIANFIYIPSSPVKQNIPINFIDMSSDSDGNIVNWTWDLDDGNIAYGEEINHTYQDDGTYFPMVIVKDNQGQTTTYSDTITIIKSNEENGIPGFEFVFFILLLIGYIIMEKRKKH